MARLVMKFGGTSVEDAAAIRRLIGIVESRISQQLVIIVSALAKVTDQLLEAGHAAANGRLGAALAIGLAAFGGALGQGKTAASALEGIARNPSAFAAIRFALIFGLVLIESLALYTFAIIFIKVS